MPGAALLRLRAGLPCGRLGLLKLLPLFFGLLGGTLSAAEEIAEGVNEGLLGGPDASLAGRVLGSETRTRDPVELRYLVLRKLTDRYAAEQAIEMTPEEINAYIRGMECLAGKDRAEREARRQETANRPAGNDLDAVERGSLTAEHDALNQLEGDLSELSRESDADADETRQARRTIAKAFIRQWQINQALYAQYGGRIIQQQGGPQPLDADRRFLQAHQARGNFEILNQAFEKPFWHYDLTDTLHSFYPPGSEAETGAFPTPWWMAD
jgi:hypothetical protein